MAPPAPSPSPWSLFAIGPGAAWERGGMTRAASSSQGLPRALWKPILSMGELRFKPFPDYSSHNYENVFKEVFNPKWKQYHYGE